MKMNCVSADIVSFPDSKPAGANACISRQMINVGAPNLVLNQNVHASHAETHGTDTHVEASICGQSE